MHRRFGYLTVLVVVLSALALLPSVAPAGVAPAGIRASYANPVRRADGHVDAGASVNRLQQMNANTYAFLVRGRQDWDDLRLEFAAAAQAAGINVWVYLLPPSECPPDPSCSGYAPYLKDYGAWARGIATLSVQYPAITAWVMDDFNANAAFFTPTYVGQIRQAGRAVQPGLEFYPVVYHNAITQSFVNLYASVIDSLIMPYRDDPYRNTLWTESVRSHLDSASALLAAKGRKLILMVYALTLSGTQVPSDVDYVRQVTTVGMEYTRSGRIAGVIQYALPLTPGRPQSGDVNFSHGNGLGALVFTVREDQATSAGSYAAAVATLRLDTGSTSCRMIIWHSDNRDTNSPIGYHAKQALVAGVKVWERDVASEGTDWYTSTPVEVAQHMVNGAAALTIRLYEKAGVANYNVIARVDDIGLSGCSIANPAMESTGGWTFTRGGGPVLAGQHTYDRAYSTAVLDAVATLYAT